VALGPRYGEWTFWVRNRSANHSATSLGVEEFSVALFCPENKRKAFMCMEPQRVTCRDVLEFTVGRKENASVSIGIAVT
jgi:hypothetical protein